jgi:hypothetical protein
MHFGKTLIPPLVHVCISSARANGAERRSGRKPGARVLIPTGYLHPGKERTSEV